MTEKKFQMTSITCGYSYMRTHRLYRNSRNQHYSWDSEIYTFESTTIHRGKSGLTQSDDCDWTHGYEWDKWSNFTIRLIIRIFPLQFFHGQRGIPGFVCQNSQYSYESKPRLQPDKFWRRRSKSASGAPTGALWDKLEDCWSWPAPTSSLGHDPQ